jgi:hypothetical protein
MARTKGWTGKLSRFGLYLQRYGVDRSKIAAGAGVTPSYISMLAHGKASPGFRAAVAIERWTTKNVIAPEHDDPIARDLSGNPIRVPAFPAPFRCGDWLVEAPSAPAAAS